jgi:hypothetical protein
MGALLVVGWLAGVLSGPGAAGELVGPGVSGASGEAVGGAGGCGLALEGKVGTVPSYPPCFVVELSAEATGLPPLLHSWTLPDGTVLEGNPVSLDTGLLGDGFQEIGLEVRNDFGVAEVPVHLVVESLGFSGAPSLTPLGDGRVEMRANTTGATEWRWTWGDGTGTGWLSGCAGYAPTHVYPGPGFYQVTVEARSCRGGPVVWSGLLEVKESEPPAVEAFRVVCATAPFCTFGVGEAVGFEVEVSGSVALYLYDWDGDGVDDEIAGAPVLEHRFSSAGFFIPRLTVIGGGAEDVAFLEAPVAVVEGDGGGEVLFSDGFESGDLRHWTVP